MSCWSVPSFGAIGAPVADSIGSDVVPALGGPSEAW